MANIAEDFSGRDEALCWIVGAGFTLTLFLALAHFEDVHPSRTVDEIADLRAVALPLEPPPPAPRPVDPPPNPAEHMVALAGLEIGAADSPVHIAVVPPDLEALIPTTRDPPGAVVRLGYLDTDLKPRVNVDADVHHIYQVSEVDQPPHAIVRVAPAGAGRFFAGARSLRVVLLVVIDVNGRAASAQIAESSGKPDFDNLVAQTVRESWEFSPAVRRGKRVKCLAQQIIRVVIGGGSPFEAR